MPKKIKLGDITCHAIYDGSRSIGSMTKKPAHGFLFGDAPKGEMKAAMKRYGGIIAETQIPFNYLLVEGGEAVTLVDVGCGDQAENGKNPGEPAGLLTESLRGLGFGVEDVDTVVISHWHWDHFGGAMTGSEATFHRADYVMSRREAEHIKANVAGWALEYLRALGDKLRLVSDLAVIRPGVTVRVAPGHTPGITITEVTSNEETLIYTSDLILHRAHFEHPGWIPSFETDKIAAEVSRRNMIEDAYRRGLMLFVPHIAGAFGRVVREKRGYKWIDET